jgi:hypothetical protein
MTRKERIREMIKRRKYYVLTRSAVQSKQKAERCE